MHAETPDKLVHIGGNGCKLCRFWSPYTEYKSSWLGLVGANWGRCLNNENITLAMREARGEVPPEEGLRTDSKDRANVDIEPLSEDTVIVSTTENYSCLKFKGKR